MKVGDRATISRRFSRDAVRAYVELGGAETALGVVPEPILAALFSYLLGVRLPGPGTNYLKQALKFHRSAEIGEELTATVEITRMRPEKSLIDLETICIDESGDIVCSGRALVLAKDKSRLA